MRPWRRASRSWRARLRVTAVAAVVLVTGLFVDAPWAAAATGPGVDAGDAAALSLVSQSSWTTAGEPFTMGLSVSSSQPASSLEIAVTVFSRLRSHSDFAQTLQGRIDEETLATLPPQTLSSLRPDPGRPAQVQIPTDGSGAAGLDLADEVPGVYPVRVELRDSTTGSVLGQLVTFLVYVSSGPAAAKLDVSWILPVYASPALQPSGQVQLSSTESQALSALASTLQTYPNVPVVLYPNPETLQALQSSGRLRDIATLATIKQLSSDPAVHPVVGSTYVPVDLGALGSSGLGSELADQVTRGTQVTSALLGTKPSSATWVVTGSLNQAGLSLLAPGAARLVVPDGDITAAPSTQSPSAAAVEEGSPFQIEGRGGYSPVAFGANPQPTLQSHFTDGSDPVLSGHQLLADLAMTYFELPNESPRGVVVDTPLDWTPDGALLSTVLSGLQASPVLQPMTLDSLFSQFSGAQLSQRTLSGDVAPPTLPAASIRATRARLTAFGSAVSPSSLPASIDNMILVSESSELRGPARKSYLAGANHAIDAQLATLSLPPDRSITLTSRTGRIPVTIVSGASYPLRAVLQVASDKLTFPQGSTRLLSLDQRNDVEYFDVAARSSGDFPLTVQLRSPQGGLVLLQGHLTIRSTTASWVGIALSIGAGAFLLLWWARSWVRGRRNRRRPATSG